MAKWVKYQLPTSTSTTNSVTVANPVATSTALATSANPSSYGLSVAFTATVLPTPTGGSLQFFDRAVALGSQVAVRFFLTSLGSGSCR